MNQQTETAAKLPVGTATREAAERRVNGSDVLRQHVLDWLTANGVETRDVPGNPYASVNDGVLTIDMWMRGEDGQQVFKPDADELMRATETFPVVVKPPVDVAEWLMPRCETCGR